MKKIQILDLVKAEFGLSSRDKAEEMIEEAVRLFLAIGEALEEPQKEGEKYTAQLGEIKIEKVYVKERSGKTPVGDDFVTPAHSKVKIKIK